MSMGIPLYGSLPGLMLEVRARGDLRKGGGERLASQSPAAQARRAAARLSGG